MEIGSGPAAVTGDKTAESHCLENFGWEGAVFLDEPGVRRPTRRKCPLHVDGRGHNFIEDKNGYPQPNINRLGFFLR